LGNSSAMVAKPSRLGDSCNTPTTNQGYSTLCTPMARLLVPMVARK